MAQILKGKWPIFDLSFVNFVNFVSDFDN
jgi:hypothetical protein